MNNLHFYNIIFPAFIISFWSEPVLVYTCHISDNANSMMDLITAASFHFSSTRIAYINIYLIDNICFKYKLLLFSNCYGQEWQ